MCEQVRSSTKQVKQESDELSEATLTINVRLKVERRANECAAFEHHEQEQRSEGLQSTMP